MQLGVVVDRQRFVYRDVGFCHKCNVASWWILRWTLGQYFIFTLRKAILTHTWIEQVEEYCVRDKIRPT